MCRKKTKKRWKGEEEETRVGTGKAATGRVVVGFITFCCPPPQLILADELLPPRMPSQRQQ